MSEPRSASPWEPPSAPTPEQARPASFSMNPASTAFPEQPHVYFPDSPEVLGTASVGPTPPPPNSSRRRLTYVLAGGGLALILALGSVAAWLLWSGGPSLADAKRECRTAFEREFELRTSSVASSSSGASILVSVTDIEILETREIEGGFEVNGTVKYTLTGAYVGTVPNTLSLTCEATESDDGDVTTDVTNRK